MLSQDARVLLVKYQKDGARHRDFRDGVSEFDEQLFEDWPLDNLRTTGYVMKEVSRHGLTPTARHDKWKTDNRLSDEDPGIAEHEVHAEVFKLAVGYDQLDLSNLVSFE